jgi:hypothetical protein
MLHDARGEWSPAIHGARQAAVRRANEEGSRMKTVRTAVSLGILAFVLGCAQKPYRGFVETPTEPVKAPDFTFTDLDGHTHHLSELAMGSVTVMALVDESASQALDLAGRLDALAKKYTYEGVEVLMVSYARPGSAMSRVCGDPSSYKVARLNIICDGTGSVKTDYRVTGKTEFVVIGPRGYIVGRTQDEAALPGLLEGVVAQHRESAVRDWAAALY